jgi:hypothetical protein
MKNTNMKTKFITVAILVCSVCVLPSYRENCPPAQADLVKIAVPQNGCPEAAVRSAERADQQLEVYPLSLMRVDL